MCRVLLVGLASAMFARVWMCTPAFDRDLENDSFEPSVFALQGAKSLKFSVLLGIPSPRFFVLRCCILLVEARFISLTFECVYVTPYFVSIKKRALS